MDEREWLAERFEHHRSHLRAVVAPQLGQIDRRRVERGRPRCRSRGARQRPRKQSGRHRFEQHARWPSSSSGGPPAARDYRAQAASVLLEAPRQPVSLIHRSRSFLAVRRSTRP
jgi:hypothetical protein